MNRSHYDKSIVTEKRAYENFSEVSYVYACSPTSFLIFYRPSFLVSYKRVSYKQIGVFRTIVGPLIIC